jgi:predicted peptidase
MHLRLPLNSLLLVLLLTFAQNLRADDFLTKTYTGPDGRTMPYRLLVPENYDAKKKYPVVLFFHGAGERGDNNVAQLYHGVMVFDTPENRGKFPCFVIAPQCPNRAQWVDMIWGAQSGIRPALPSASMQLALKCLDQVTAEYGTDPTRIYVAGLSMGGYAVWDCITRFPERFAAGVAVCGGGDEATVTNAVAQVPVWAFHSADDPIVPVVRTRHMIDAMKKAGGHPHYTEYQGLGHGSWDKAYSEPNLLPWLFSQRLGVPDKSWRFEQPFASSEKAVRLNSCPPPGSVPSPRFSRGA